MDIKAGTTAYYRQMAALCEQACDWPAAAAYWQKALDVYPAAGSLAERDKKRITALRDACQNMAAA